MCSISVIIPVYNSAPFLSRCIGSLISQSFKDWEAICINDGSKDDSGSILDSFAEKDSRIQVFHKENEGVSAARNLALEKVRGKYIMFVDSDDFLHPQAMEICHHMAEKDSSDLVAFTYSRRYRTLRMIANHLFLPETGHIRHPHYDIGSIQSKVTDDIFQWATEYSKVKDKEKKRWMVKHCQPWRCLYRAERMRHIRFIKGIIYEDFPWWGEVLMQTRKATIINLPLYYYYPNKGSYIISSRQAYRITSLNTALQEAERLSQRISNPDDRRLWEQNFIIPFRSKLEDKIRKYGVRES